jgi:hypothetical protein
MFLCQNAKGAKGRSSNDRIKNGRKKSGRMMKWPNDSKGIKLQIRLILEKIYQKSLNSYKTSDFSEKKN